MRRIWTESFDSHQLLRGCFPSDCAPRSSGPWTHEFFSTCRLVSAKVEMRAVRLRRGECFAAVGLQCPRSHFSPDKIQRQKQENRPLPLGHNPSQYPFKTCVVLCTFWAVSGSFQQKHAFMIQCRLDVVLRVGFKIPVRSGYWVYDAACVCVYVCFYYVC